MKYVNENDIAPLEFPGRTLTVLISPEDGSDHLTTAISKVPPGGMLPWHVHESSDEVIYVMSGEGLASHESLDEPVRIFPGMALYMPMGKKHCIENKGDEEMRLYCSFSPGIRFASPK
ncbi:MAG: cupin domain-containing protein [Deltaproteobacteria bacterium]|nr:cupin domain-containing protein [Deltaproteobacteria bacterium]MBW2123662.1 cupin domain-containing protein [Deltaproteobacteria bacterium]